MTDDCDSYLELADWDLKSALRSAKEDNEWEKEMDENSLRSGEIRITMNAEGFNARGAGITRSPSFAGEQQSATTSPTTTPAKKRTPVKPIDRSAIPAIASKSVKALDVVNAAHQHDNYGVELATLSKDEDEE